MRYVIVGNGAAAATAVETLTEVDPKAAIEVYGEEPYWAYRRPQLPEFLAGGVEEEKILIHPPAWYEGRGVAVHRGVRVEALEPSSGVVRLADGRTVPYDRLLLATGATSFIPPLVGANRTGVFALRTLDDARAIRAYAQHCRRAVVLGGGLLGLEAARALRALGLEVTVVEVYGWLLPRQLDRPGGEILGSIIAGMGIQVLTGTATECIVGPDDRASGLRLEDGREIEGDLVLISAGVRSRVELAREAGLAVNRGIVVDGRLRTGVEGIYAAGDCAEFEGRVYGILPAAWEQARAAAQNMAGRETLYTGTVPSTTLKVVGVDLTSIGEVQPEGEGFVELRRSEPEAGRYVKLVLRDGRLVGAILLGERKRVRLFNRWIAERTDVSAYAERLLEPDFEPPK
ncbi:MAG: NAD(P)/FAD-dependent oxidoreductase [Chloroflexia bacterium]